MPVATNLPVLCIVGPTCTGKTALSVAIARQLPVEIISADSRQVFRFLDIGTAKPPPDVLRAIRHHFIDIVNPDETYSAGRFGHDAARTVAEIVARGHRPLVVGGSGLYIRALIDGLHHAPGEDAAIRRALETRAEHEGIDTLFAELRTIDPITANGIHMMHRRRIIRALEVVLATGIPLSIWKRQQAARAFSTTLFGLRWQRNELYARIDARVDEMMSAGLLDEVLRLQSKGYSDAMQSLNTPGYKELFACLRGEHSLERAVELIKQHTRNYAKRQVTWFKADPRIRWRDVNGETKFAEVADEILLTAA